MKKLTRSLCALLLGLVMIGGLTSARAAATEPPELPTSVGYKISTLNSYDMTPSRSYFDEELGSMVFMFKLSDAGKLEAFLSYASPFYRLPDDLALLKSETDRSKSDGTRALMWTREILNDVLLNGGGGPDYRYVETTELIQVAEKVLKMPEFQKMLAAAKPLVECEETDARALRQAFSAEELAQLCQALKESAYGEYALRWEWLEEMEFSLTIPVDEVRVAGETGASEAVSQTTTTTKK